MLGSDGHVVAADLAETRRTSPLSAVLDLVRPDAVRTLVPAAAVAISSGRFVLVLGGIAALIVVRGVLSWWRRTWSFDGEVLHLAEGVFVRSERQLPVARIQHVEVERRLRHQLFGLAAVRVESAGGSGTELELDAISHEDARALRAAIAARRARPSVGDRGSEPVGGPARDETGQPLPPVAPPGPAARGTEVLRLRPGRLFLAGVTGPEVIAVLAALAVGFDSLVDLGVDPDSIDSVEVGTAVAVVLALVGVPIWFATAGLIAVVRKWDLTVTVRAGHAGDELHVTYGLLRQQEFVMLIHRLQSVRITQRLLLRPFGRADVRMRSAGSASGRESSRIEVPLVSPEEIDRLLGFVLPVAVPRPRLAAAPRVARRRALVRSGGLGALGAAAAAAALWRGLGAWALLALPVGVTVGLVLGGAWYRGLGWAQEAGVHHSRQGAVRRQTAIAPLARIQSGAVHRGLLQRRWGLADARLDLVGEAVVVRERPLGEARAIARSVLEDGSETAAPHRSP